MANDAVTLEFIVAGAPVVEDLNVGAELDNITVGAPVLGNLVVTEEAFYGVKYRFSFESRLGRDVRIDVKQKFYTGSINTVTHAGNEPVKIRREPEDELKIKTIYGTSAAVMFKSTDTFEFNEFLAQGEDEYLVSIYLGSTPTLFWSGYVLPDLFTLPLIKKPVINLQCADMLSIVSKQTFAKVGGERFEGRNNLETYLGHFFRLVNTDIDTLYDGTNIRATGDSYTTSFFSQYYFHAEAFKKNVGQSNEEWFTWGEFLDSVLKSAGGCTLEISNGAFHITRIEAKSASYKRIPITNLKTNWSYGTEEDHDPVVQWPNFNGNTHMVDQSGFIRCDLIYKEQTVDFDTGKIIESAVIDGDFALDQWNTATDLKRWTDDPGFTYQRVDAVISGVEVSYGAQIDGKNSTFDDTSPTTDALFSEPISIQVSDGTNNTFTFSTYVKVPLSSGSGTNGSTIYFQLIAVVSATNYYYDDVTDEWTTTVKYLSTTSINAYNAWKKVEFTDIGIAIGSTLSAATLSVGLVKIESTEAGVDGVQFANTRVDFTTVENYVDTDVNTSSQDRSITPDNIDLVVGDAPSVTYAGAISKGADKYSTKTTTWARQGVTESLPLHEILTSTIMSNGFYNSPTFILKSTNLGLFHFNTTLKYSNLNLGKSVYMMTTGVEYGMRSDEWTGEWKEILRTDYGNFLLLESGDFFLLESGDKLIIE